MLTSAECYHVPAEAKVAGKITPGYTEKKSHSPTRQISIVNAIVNHNSRELDFLSPESSQIAVTDQ